MSADNERARRLEIWNLLKQESQTSFNLEKLIERRICSNEDLFWIDREFDLSKSGAVLSLRKIDRDSVFDDGIVVTLSAETNPDWAQSLLTAKKVNLPIFVVYPDRQRFAYQEARLAWIREHDNRSNQFLALFDESDLEYSAAQSVSEALSAFSNDTFNQQHDAARKQFWIAKLEQDLMEVGDQWTSRIGGPKFSISPHEFAKSRIGAGYTALCGPNNGGKTLLLRHLKAQFGRGSYMIGAQRFSHVAMIQTQKFDPNFHSSIERQFIQTIGNTEVNSENNFIDLQKTILNLNTTKRAALFKLCSDLIGTTFSMKQLNESDNLSPHYIDMDGQNLSIGSSGTRLLMTVLGICMDEKFQTILIDEPELGLSPNVQARVSAFLADDVRRTELLPHLKSIIVATHSHLFLDRTHIRNNFFIERTPELIAVRQVTSFAQFHRLQFNLLGNSLEAMFLPSAFVFVEGPTDQSYLERCFQLRFPDKRILFKQTSTEQSGVRGALHRLEQSVGDISKSPYQNRIFVVFDSTHSRTDPQHVIEKGIPTENVCIWSKNGIEYLYPPSLMSKIFGCTIEELKTLSIADDEVSLNGVHRRKKKLCEEITQLMDKETHLPIELENKLLARISAAIS